MDTTADVVMCVLLLVELKSMKFVQYHFCCKYNFEEMADVLTYASITQWDKKIKETGSLLPMTDQHAKCKVSEENINGFESHFRG